MSSAIAARLSQHQAGTPDAPPELKKLRVEIERIELLVQKNALNADVRHQIAGRLIAIGSSFANGSVE